MKTFKFAFLFLVICFNYSCFAQSEVSSVNCRNDTAESVVFVKKVGCEAVHNNAVYRYTVSDVNITSAKTNSFQGMKPSRTPIVEAISQRMLVLFATNAEPTYTGIAPITKFGITYSGGAAKLGFKKSF